MSKTPTPPRHLSKESKKLWRTLCADYDFTAHELRVLQLLCEALDRAEQARQQIELEGLTVPTADGGAKTHPACGIERDAQATAMKAVRLLNLSTEVEDPRLPVFARK